MKSLSKLNIKCYRDLESLLRMDFNELKYAQPNEFINLMSEGRSITVHHYPIRLGHWRNRGCLLELKCWPWHQIYLTISDDKVYYSLGHGDSSGSREHHNKLIDYFLKNPEARNEIMTAVVVADRRKTYAYYYHDSYAYVNHDIGMNYHNIRDELMASGIPYSYGRGIDKFKVGFINEEEEVIYTALKDDLINRELRESKHF